jgi:hypothetical protein
MPELHWPKKQGKIQKSFSIEKLILEKMKKQTYLSIILALSLIFFIGLKVSAQSAPVAVDDTAHVKKYHKVWINVLQNDYDPDGDGIEVFAKGFPAHGQILSLNDSMLRYKSDKYIGWDSVQYKIRKKNNHNFQDSAWLFIEVLPNALPVVNCDPIPIEVGNMLELNIYDLAWDPDGDDFKLNQVKYPKNGEAGKISDSIFWVRITQNHEGLDSMRVSLEELASEKTNYSYLLLEVSSNPEYPYAIDDTIVAFPGDTCRYYVLENDFDLQGDELQIWNCVDKVNMDYYDVNDTVITFIPRIDADTGIVLYFDYHCREVNNPEHLSNRANAYVHILPNPDLPVAVDDFVEATAGLPVDIYALLNDYDLNGDEFIISDVVFEEKNGILAFNDSVITFSPFSFITQNVILQYKISEVNNSAHYCWGNINVNITENNNLPVAINDTVYVQSYDSLLFNPLANDITPYEGIILLDGEFSGDRLFYLAFSMELDSLTNINAKINARANYSGIIKKEYRFYHADNPAMFSTWGEICIIVEPNPDSLLAVDDEITVNSLSMNSINIILNDINPNNIVFTNGMILGNNDFAIMFYRDSLVFVKPKSLTHGNYEFYYYLTNFLSPTNPILSFAKLKVYVTNLHQADFLYVNRINAGFTAFGQNFWNPETDNDFVKFEVPKGSGKKTLFNNAMWIGGMADDTLHLAAERYRQVGADFWTGPVSDSYPVDDLMKYGVWKINKADIDYHIAHYQDSDYEPIESIATWPGNGNTALGQVEQLAPYYDLNLDGIYDPYNGDFPLVRGDQSLYFIYNDGREIHTESQGKSMNVEIHCNAYAFDNVQDSNLYNTIFVHYDLYNRSEKTYEDTYLGFFLDFDLGYAWDDFVGCDVSRGAAYVYNGNAIDGTGEPDAYGENPPVQSMVILGGATMPEDGIDNPAGGCNESVNGLNFGDGIADNERLGLTGFSYFCNTSANPNITDPQSAPEYYNYLSGLWKDNTSLMYGGTGHYFDPQAVGPACKFMFPGASDPLNWGTNCNFPNGGFNQNNYYWDEGTMENLPGDRRGLSITGPFTFAPGDVQSVDVAYVYARDFDLEDDKSALDIMNQRIDTIRQRSHNGKIIFLPTYSVGISDHTPVKLQVNVFPNPANGDEIYIDLGAAVPETKGSWQINNLLGCTVRAGTINKEKIQTVRIEGLQTGIYVLSVQIGDKHAVQKILIQK